MNLDYYIQLILIITYKLVVIWGSAMNLINYPLLYEINKSGSENRSTFFYNSGDSAYKLSVAASKPMAVAYLWSMVNQWQ
jgi:hypothetical protein